MNTDHINYQQQIAQAVNQEKDQQLLENSDSAPKQQISSSALGINQKATPTSDEYQTANIKTTDNQMDPLTPRERRERIYTLLIIAFISLLTGTIVHYYCFI